MTQTSPLLQPCTNCATLLDVTDEEPFAQIHCPMCGTALRARTQFNNFILQELLGTGGMGAVYKALDVNLNRYAALKVVRKEFSRDNEYLAKFETEAKITASINHPHVVKVFSFGSAHNLFYIAMELVDKGSLDDLLNLQGRVAEIQVLEVGIQIAQGLQAAYENGLIHRDVKPGNILFSDAHTAKIVDFGLALLMEQAAEGGGEVWGTPYYVAPEKLDRQPEDFRSDIYSLGATLFHAIAGRPPFEAETASLVALKHLKSQAVSLQAFAPDVSNPTAYAINRTLHKDPEERYQSYEELIEHLDYARTQLLENAAKPRQKARVVLEDESQQKAVGWLVFGVIGFMILAAVLVFGFMASARSKRDSAPGTMVSAMDATQRFHAARKLIVDGNFGKAKDAFEDLADQRDIPQPTRNWILLHEGLVSLLQDDLGDATGSFSRLQKTARYSEDAKEQELTTLFLKVANAMDDEAPVDRSIGNSFFSSNAQAIGFLVLGLKDYQLGRDEDAIAFLQMFLNSEPIGPNSWIQEYKWLARRYVNELEKLRRLSTQAAAARTGYERKTLLEAVRAAKQESKVKGRILQSLEKLESSLK